MGCCGKAIRLVGKGASVTKKLIVGKRVRVDTQRKRLKICGECDLYSCKVFGPVCGTLYSGKERNEEVEGCGCLLAVKVSLKGESCPRGKW